MSLEFPFFPKMLLHRNSQSTLKLNYLSLQSVNKNNSKQSVKNSYDHYISKLNIISNKKSRMQKRQKIRNAILQSFSIIQNDSYLNQDKKYNKKINHFKDKNQYKDQDKNKSKKAFNCDQKYHKTSSHSLQQKIKKDSLSVCKKDIQLFQSLINYQSKPLIPKVLPLIIKHSQSYVNKMRSKTLQNLQNIQKQKHFQDIRIIVNHKAKKKKIKIFTQTNQNCSKQDNFSNFPKRSSSLDQQSKFVFNSKVVINNYSSYEKKYQQKQIIQKQHLKELQKFQQITARKKYKQLSLAEKIFDSKCPSRLNQIKNLSKVQIKIQNETIEKQQSKKQNDEYLQSFSGWNHISYFNPQIKEFDNLKIKS